MKQRTAEQQNIEPQNIEGKNTSEFIIHVFDIGYSFLNPEP